LKKPQLFLLVISLWSLSGCPEPVLGLPDRKAAEALKSGDISVLLEADPALMGDVSRIDSRAPFYAGLLVLQTGDEDRARALFLAALDCPDPFVRQAALEKLLGLLFPAREDAPPDEHAKEFEALLALAQNKSPDPLWKTLEKAAAYGSGRYGEIGLAQGESAWDRALGANAFLRGGETALAAEALRGILYQAAPGAPQRWALSQGKAAFSPAEYEAALGYFDSERRNYGTALARFEPMLKEAPEFFLEYPELLKGLGRSFLNSNRRKEGVELFNRYLSRFPPQGSSASKYLLLHYLGRMERLNKKYAEAEEYFRQAMEAAPNDSEKDTCIWYILDLNNTSTKKTREALAKYAPLWSDRDFFDDIFETLSAKTAAAHEWAAFQEIYGIVEKYGGGASRAQYAYILGRLIEEGFVKSASGADTYFRSALNEKQGAYYFRSLAASHLGENLAPVPQESAGESAAAFPYLDGFFEFGCASYVMPEIEKYKDEVDIPELRSIARRFMDLGQVREAVRVFNIYSRKDGWTVEREDLEIAYPRRYLELIEKYSALCGIPSAVFLGLVRTESLFNAGIASAAGAIGLAQIMPETGKASARRIAAEGGPDYLQDGEVALTDPETNVHIGAWYLASLTKDHGGLLLALLAYNGGPNRVRRWRSAEPDLPLDLFLETVPINETRNYGRRVLGSAAVYGFLYYGMSMEQVFDYW
jgi:soluble lytic murein transglycosylase